MEFAKKKYKISFLGGPTTPTYSMFHFSSLKFFLAFLYVSHAKNECKSQNTMKHRFSLLYND